MNEGIQLGVRQTGLFSLNESFILSEIIFFVKIANRDKVIPAFTPFRPMSFSEDINGPRTKASLRLTTERAYSQILSRKGMYII